MGTAYQQLPQHLVALLGDAFLTGVPVPRLIPGGYEPKVRAHGAAPLEAVGFLQGEHEGQGRERPDPFDLAQELGLRIMFFGDRF